MQNWITAENIGQLTHEITLIQFDIPLLFTCLDANRNRYLVVCSNEETGEYVAAKITTTELLDMLQNTETMYDTFRNAGKIARIHCVPGKKEYVWDTTDQKSISDEMLPDKGEYFELYNEKIREFITGLRQSALDEYKPGTQKQHQFFWW